PAADIENRLGRLNFSRGTQLEGQIFRGIREIIDATVCRVRVRPVTPVVMLAERLGDLGISLLDRIQNRIEIEEIYVIGSFLRRMFIRIRFLESFPSHSFVPPNYAAVFLVRVAQWA